MAEMPADATDGETQTGSVVERALESFLQELEAEPGFKEIAGRLRRAILQDHDASEAGLKRAIFDDIA